MGDIEMSFCFYVKDNNIDLDLSWSEEVGFTNKKTMKRFSFYRAGFLAGQRG